MSEARKMFALRLSAEERERIDALVAAINRDRLTPNTNKSAVVRTALEIGLRSLERRHKTR